DNADPADITRCIDEAWRLGPIDVLVNNDGISPYYKRAEFVTVEDFDAVTQVKLRGTYFCSVEVAKTLFEAGRLGDIVTNSSAGGTLPLDRLAPYSGVKAGIHQLTRAFALEWADRGVRVNEIAPGFTATDFTEDLFTSRWGEKLLADIPM